MSEGDPADCFGLVISGSVRVEKLDLSGNRNIFAVLREGELFAEAFAFSGAERLSVDIRAAEDCEVLVIPAEAILADPRLTRNALRLVAGKMFLFDQRIEVISRRRTRDKLLMFLQQQRTRSGSDSFTVPFDRQELAEFLGVDRSGLSVEIHRLVREGKILCEGPRFTIL